MLDSLAIWPVVPGRLAGLVVLQNIRSCTWGVLSLSFWRVLFEGSLKNGGKDEESVGRPRALEPFGHLGSGGSELCGQYTAEEGHGGATIRHQ